MSTTLGEVLRRFGPAYLREHGLSTAQAKAWRAIAGCRTPALGGQLLACDGCGAQQWRWHSCRNRHCPQCQSRQREAWRQARLAELLDVPYCHLVFTLPHELNPLAGAHPRWVYDTLMHCTAQTLTTFAADPKWLGGTGAFTLVLHTWTQDLRRHLHVHALMACGALGRDAQGKPTWLTPTRGERFLFPVQALSQVFRAKFIAALQAAQRDAKTLAHDPLRVTEDAAATERQRAQRLAALWAKPWVVYAKTPLAGPAAVLDYLSRYTHRTAIGNERLLGIEGDTVRLRVRVNGGGKAAPAGVGGSSGKRVIALPGVQFIGRLLQHVLPSGFKRIRHFGLLAPAAKTVRLAAARVLLAMPAANPVAAEQAREFMQRVAAIDIERCPHCAQTLGGRWRVVGSVAAQRPDFGAAVVHGDGSGVACRGPP